MSRLASSASMASALNAWAVTLPRPRASARRAAICAMSATTSETITGPGATSGATAKPDVSGSAGELERVLAGLRRGDDQHRAVSVAAPLDEVGVLLPGAGNCGPHLAHVAADLVGWRGKLGGAGRHRDLL